MRDSERGLLLAAMARKVRALSMPDGIQAGRRSALDSVKAKARLAAAPLTGGGHGKGSHGDPTGDAVAAADHAEVYDDLTRWDDTLRLLDRLLGDLLNESGNHVRRQIQPEPPKQKQLRGCKSCARLDGADGKPYFCATDPDRYKEFCRNCGDWRGTYGHLPPKGVAEHWRKGYGNLTSKIVTAAYATEGRQAPPNAAA